MCAEFTLAEETEFGDLHVLCESYSECLANYVHALPAASAFESEPFDVAANDSVDDPPPVALEVFETFHATVAIIELSYFDQDFRSEFGAVHETTFSAASPDVLRVHFFAAAPPTDLIPMRDFVESARESYRGYVIVRPQIPTSIGRSMVAPPPLSGPLREGLTVADRVRTAVVEDVNLFGVALQVHGVPFMEQDGHLLRCAHVVAWMAHYTAVLKGVVSRVPSGRLNKSADSVLAFGRSYPSPGASDIGFSHLFARVGLPPEHVAGARFRAPRPLEWYDNTGFVERVQHARDAAKAPSGDTSEYELLWATNNLTGTICRYLNSGIPCVFNRGDHSVLICGYFRERDRAGGDVNVSAVAGFFVQDDQAGPYQELAVDDMVASLLSAPSRTSLIVPLPPGLWLSGQKAERAGATLFRGLVKSLHALLAPSQHSDEESDVAIPEPEPADWQADPTTPSQDPVAPDEDERNGVRPPVDTELTHPAVPLELDAEPDGDIALAGIYDDLLGQVTNGATPSNLTIRSYAMDGADFKVDFVTRVPSPNARRLAGYVPMPKYVWVIEVLDRTCHRNGTDPVVATVVLDGSASSYDSARVPIPLLAHLPGRVSRLVEIAAGDPGWLATSTEKYASGRWTGATDGFHLSAPARARRAKSALR